MPRGAIELNCPLRSIWVVFLSKWRREKCHLREDEPCKCYILKEEGNRRRQGGMKNGISYFEEEGIGLLEIPSFTSSRKMNKRPRRERESDPSGEGRFQGNDV